jgi:hypothetical protein
MMADLGLPLDVLRGVRFRQSAIGNPPSAIIAPS